MVASIVPPANSTLCKRRYATFGAASTSVYPNLVKRHELSVGFFLCYRYENGRVERDSHGCTIQIINKYVR